jgi:hypothetical protein
MSKASPRDQKKWEIISEPRSQVIWEGTPCLEKTWMTNSLASAGAVISSTVGIKMPFLDSQSTMIRIVVWLSDSGRCSMKSIEMEFHGVVESRALLVDSTVKYVSFEDHY